MGDVVTEYQRWRPHFAAVADPRYWPMEWLDARVMSGEIALLTSDKSAVLAEIRTYPSGQRDVHVLVAAGDMDNIAVEMMDRCTEMAKMTGCIAVLVESRAGWARVLKPRGFEQFQVCLRKEV